MEHKPSDIMAAPLRVYHAQNAPLTVSQLLQFFDDLNACYSSLVTFFNISSQQAAELVIARRYLKIKGEYIIMNEPSAAFDVLRVKSININSPGWLEFWGSIKPFQVLVDFYKEYHAQRRWSREYRIVEKRAALELELQQLAVIQEKINFLRRNNVAENQIQMLVAGLVARPIQQLIEENTSFNIIDTPENMPNG